MPGSMAEKQQKVFIHMKSRYSLTVVVLMVLFGNCKRETIDDRDLIPNVPVTLNINLDLPAYNQLQLPGAWMYFDGGSKGIIVYHGYDFEYRAYDRNCSYQPFENCARIEMEDNSLYAHCGETQKDSFITCCGSRFDLSNAFPVNGPAVRPLKLYNVFKQGNSLLISN